MFSEMYFYMAAKIEDKEIEENLDRTLVHLLPYTDLTGLAA